MQNHYAHLLHTERFSSLEVTLGALRQHCCGRPVPTGLAWVGDLLGKSVQQMRTAIDTNVLSALWSREPLASQMASMLGQVQSESGLVVSTPVNTPLLDLWHSIEFDCKRPEGQLILVS